MRTYRFYKDIDGWFVDLPEWTGEKWELELVMGADTFLEILSQGENEIHVIMSTEYFEGANTLQFTQLGRLEGPELGEGSWYHLKEYNGINYNLNMWLCHVTTFVFGEYPDKIYYK